MGLGDAPTNNIVFGNRAMQIRFTTTKLFYCFNFTAQLFHGSRTEMMCQLAPGFSLTDGILAPESLYYLLSPRSMCWSMWSSFFSTLPCVGRPVTTSGGPSVKFPFTWTILTAACNVLGCLKEIFYRMSQTRNIFSRTLTDRLSFPPEPGIRTDVVLSGSRVYYFWFTTVLSSHSFLFCNESLGHS